jgi:hypothetical protein
VAVSFIGVGSILVCHGEMKYENQHVTLISFCFPNHIQLPAVVYFGEEYMCSFYLIKHYFRILLLCTRCSRADDSGATQRRKHTDIIQCKCIQFICYDPLPPLKYVKTMKMI